MAVTIKSEREIELMRQAGKYIAKVHEELAKEIKPGMSTYQIDKIGEELIRSYGCIPCKGYEGFPAALCVSVNDEVVHGIPRKDHFVDNGDIVSLDFCLSYKGYQSDCARTLPVGEISNDAKQLLEVTKQSFFEGIKFAKEGCHLYEISAAINDYVDQFGYGVVRDLVGHGIGREMHEDPQIPNVGKAGKGPRLQPGMTLAIEPMITEGTWEVDVLEDDWTAVTLDGGLAAHYENTVVITDGEPELLTL